MTNLPSWPWLKDRLRLRRGGVVAALGLAGAFGLVAQNGHFRFSVPLGAACVVVAAWGILDALGSFDDEDAPAAETSARALATPVLALLAAAVAFACALAGAQSGVGPSWAWGILVTALFVAGVAATFRLGVALGPWATDETGARRPLARRHGFWLVALTGALYLPTLGSASLWDPWETHYGEVAREILSRDDWISLWWVQEGWFWSKPILSIWMQSLAMSSLGTSFSPGEVLAGASGHLARPEWVVRAPTVLFSIVAVYVLYKGVAREHGRRAGMLGGVVLVTMPDWLFISHQTMTDMPYVAGLSCALGLVLVGLSVPEAQTARVYRVTVGRFAFGLTAWHLVMGAVLACALPQILLVASRNVELVIHGAGPHGLRLKDDLFTSGSAGNCGVLPGNEACRTVSATVHGLPPLAQALLWTALLAGLVALNLRERRVRCLCYLGAWLFAALATMAKGPAGLVLPALAVLAFVAVRRQWGELVRLGPVSGLLLVAVVALPWYVAMYVRHGAGFTDRLIFFDMVARAVRRAEDANDGHDNGVVYYIWQLGYAVFPWTGLVPVALLRWLRGGDRDRAGHGDTALLLTLWFLVTFALFSFMGTKFHHYVLPAVPPVAMLVGVLLDEMLERASRSTPSVASAHTERMLGAASAAGALLVLLVARDLVVPNDAGPGAIELVNMFIYNYRRPWPETLDFARPIAWFGGAAAVLALGLAARRARRLATWGTVALGAAWAAFCMFDFMARLSPHWGQRDVIAAYYTARASEAEPIIAYQMNWKGESFYTGNRIATFVSTGAPFTSWMKEQRDKGTKVVYLVTEPGRMGGLRAEVGARAYREVTDRATCNKFVLVRAEL